MKTIARCIATIVLLSCSITFADEQSHRKAAEDFLEATNVRKVLDSTVDQMLDAQVKANPSIAHLRGVMKNFLSKYLSYDGVKEDLISLYAEQFTEDELKQLTAFYQTPVGKKAVEKLPILTTKGAQIGVSKVQANQGELKQMIMDEEKKQAK